MLVTIALQVFGQVKSDSVLVSRLDLIKQIELNDKRKAQWDYCVDAVSKADSVVVASRRYIASLDTVIALKDETITLLTLAKDVAIDNRNELRKQLKLQKRKGTIKVVTVGVSSAGGASLLTALAIWLKGKD